jgi:hypothetical protein
LTCTVLVSSAAATTTVFSIPLMIDDVIAETPTFVVIPGSPVQIDLLGVPMIYGFLSRIRPNPFNNLEIFGDCCAGIRAAAGDQSVEKTVRAVFALRYPAKPRPVKPSSIIAQVDGSGIEPPELGCITFALNYRLRPGCATRKWGKMEIMGSAEAEAAAPSPALASTCIPPQKSD